MSVKRMWIAAFCPTCHNPSECTTTLATMRVVDCPCGVQLATGNGTEVTFTPGVDGRAFDPDNATHTQWFEISEWMMRHANARASRPR